MTGNPFGTAKPAAKRPKTYTNDSILEALRDLSGGVGKTVTRDVVGKIGADALTSVFGGAPRSGELRPNEAIDLTPKEQPRQAARQPEFRPAATRPALQEDTQKVAQQIEAVRAELKAIAASIQMLNKQIGKAISETPVNPGVYHANYFERLRGILKILREQIDDSRSWMALHTGRKKKIGYWGMYKKHGTTFGLSNERSLATQAG